MDALFERAQTNGIAVEKLDAAELRRREPAIEGVGAILVHATGIVDYKAVCAAMAAELTRQGGTIELGTEVTAIQEKDGLVTVAAGERRWTAAKLIACAGLQSDRLARLAGLAIEHRIVPFRGEYYRLPPARNTIVRHLIYPVPDPALPFLGIHLTRMIDGSVTVGPNAVLGLAREELPQALGRPQGHDRPRHLPGLWRLLAANIGSGTQELANSLWKRGYLAACRKCCPALTLDDLRPMEAGIRAPGRDGRRAAGARLPVPADRAHAARLQRPSPAATSSIPIGRMIADRCFGAG